MLLAVNICLILPPHQCARSNMATTKQKKKISKKKKKKRTNGPVNAHLISWPSKAQNIQNLENIW